MKFDGIKFGKRKWDNEKESIQWVVEQIYIQSNLDWWFNPSLYLTKN